jgi:DNA-binding MarR family transcriptional regulator
MTHKNRLRAKVRPYVYHLKAVADVQRLSLVYLLSNGPLQLRELIDAIGLSPGLVHHHIKILEQNKWITRVPKSRYITYEINAKALTEFLELFKGTEIGREVETK